MKKLVLFGASLALVILGMSFENVERVERVHNRSGAPGGYTGSPADGKTCTDCHSGTAIDKTGIITSDIPAEGYTPGATYTITVTLNNEGTTRWGFSLSPQNNAGTMLGTWGTVDAETQFVGGKYATHKLIGSNGTNSKVWTLNWTAPAAGTGEVTFYGAFNIADANNTTTGDIIWKSSMTVGEQGANTIAGPEGLRLKAYAANQHLVVNWMELSDAPATISVLDIQGRMLKQWNNVSRNQLSWTGAVEDVPAGIYLIRVESDGKTATQKIQF
ncbi:MAG: T9SS type A sorting domain-containing protein [Bacteroidota bacterium]|nr:T9SS type A sorting domain-containing protein [Bacteroidota bacterium]MDX5431505.1 T9SS type A sorting domain-containing protein [Bacteroidota bacterium]MDX5470229.1 T9SS type A sorting domain-containing protein [Bacteroidota bacterium]